MLVNCEVFLSYRSNIKNTIPSSLCAIELVVKGCDLTPQSRASPRDYQTAYQATTVSDSSISVYLQFIRTRGYQYENIDVKTNVFLIIIRITC